MKIMQLKYFQAICNYGSISNASKYLHVSQPSMTTALKDLEGELGIPLFRRERKKLILTEEGTFFLQKINQLIQDFDQLEGEMHDLVNKRNYIRLGVPLQVGAYFLPIIINKFRINYPEIELELIEGDANNILEMVNNEQIDMAIAAVDVENENIRWEPLYQTEICYCVSSSNTLTHYSKITFEKSCQKKLVLFPETFYTTKRFVKACAEYSVIPEIYLFTTQLHTIKNLVRRSDLGTFLLREAIEYDTDIVGISLDKPLFATIGLLTKKGKIIYKDSKRLIHFLKNECLWNTHPSTCKL
jgi:DNA-binding transcriptional LysR family regulator